MLKSKPKFEVPNKICLSRISKYKALKFELLTINAIMAAINNIKPLADSNLKNHLNGLVR